MRRSNLPILSLLFALMLIMPVWSLTPQARVVAQVDPASVEEPRATVGIDLMAGERAWRPVLRETVADDSPMTQYPVGVVVVLEDPLLLFLDDEGSMERLAASDAFAIPETVSARAVAMMAEEPVRYLTVELVDPAAIPEGDAEEELRPFGVEAGAYTMLVWQVDTALDIPEKVAEHLGSISLPMFVFVRDGEIEVPSDDPSGTPHRVTAGKWIVVAPGTQIAAGSGSEPPVLVFVTLEQPEVEATAPEVPASSQGSTGVQPSGPAAVQSTVTPTPSPETLPTPTPSTICIQPRDAQGNCPPAPPPVSTTDKTTEPPPSGGTTDEGSVDYGGVPGEGNTGGAGQDGGIPITNPEGPVLIVTPADEGGSGRDDITIMDNVPLPNPEVPEGGSGGFKTSPILATGNQPNTSVADVADDDGDGLTNHQESRHGTKPDKKDTDGDGLTDGDEVKVHRTKPTVTDTDEDGLSDGNEVTRYRTKPAAWDSEGDGLGDGYELGAGLDPLDFDFDDDDLSDGDEVNVYGTYPKVYDSDEDGLSDGAEVLSYGSNPLDRDYDNDCLADGDEVARGTDIFAEDSDGDGLNDGTEIQHEYNPLDDDYSEGIYPIFNAACG